jgi:flotillin
VKTETPIWLTLLAILFFPITLVVAAARYVKAGPNEVLIISGRRTAHVDAEGQRVVSGYRIVRGGGTVVWPIIESVKSLSLELMNLEVKTPEVYTVHGVPVAVDGVVQIKVRGDDESIAFASEQFLSRPLDDIMKTAVQVCDGHLRAVLGASTIEDIYTKRAEFADKVKETASVDLAKMGLEIISFTIKIISDPRGYLEALGRPRTAQVKRDAIIGEASADEEAKIFRYQVDTKIEEARRDHEMKRSEYEAEISRIKAEADLAYDLQRFKTAQSVKGEEIRLGIVEKEMQAELEEKEVARRERELLAEVVKPAEAERQRIETLASAEKARQETEAAGEAQAIKARGFAEAEVIKQKGLSEAETMGEKASAWGQYNEAAVTEMFVNILPKMAEAVASPLSKTEKIVVVSNGGGDSVGTGASKITRDVTNVIAQLPPMVEALTGVKLEELLKRLPGLRGDTSNGSEDRGSEEAGS